MTPSKVSLLDTSNSETTINVLQNVGSIIGLIGLKWGGLKKLLCELV